MRDVAAAEFLISMLLWFIRSSTIKSHNVPSKISSDASNDTETHRSSSQIPYSKLTHREKLIRQKEMKQKVNHPSLLIAALQLSPP
jgi:hypothetical protein